MVSIRLEDTVAKWLYVLLKDFLNENQLTSHFLSGLKLHRNTKTFSCFLKQLKGCCLKVYQCTDHFSVLSLDLQFSLGSQFDEAFNIFNISWTT